MDTLAKRRTAGEIDALPPATVTEAVENAVYNAATHLVALQSSKGYWVGELEADVSVSSGYIPLTHFLLGRVDPIRKRKAVAFVTGKQNPDGSWPAFHGGPGDLNVTLQAYFALKLAGISAKEPLMRRAREFVLACGGASRANVFTRIWLALFGQYDWRGTPTVPPEIVLLPNWFYLNIYEFASWSRATIVALTVVLTCKPVCAVPEAAGISELYIEPEGRRVYPLGGETGLFGWRRLFLAADSLIKLWEKLPARPGRGYALRRAEEWIVDHQEADGSWGGIMLPWIYSLMALKCLGYATDHPVMTKGLAGLESFIAEDGDTLRLQPATSPVWDTAWTIVALRESGMPQDHPSLLRAARWLLEQEIRVGGDWLVKNPATPPGGWAFEFENDRYPDMDDSAVVARALCKLRLDGSEDPARAEAIERATRWVGSMQSRDGGWSAFDLNNDRALLAHVPFAEFMSPLDPTCADVTAHVLELLGERGLEGAVVRDGVQYLKRVQQPDGSWYGRWGVNYLYGTALVLTALKAVHEDMQEMHVRRAVNWLSSRQNLDGGWGESCWSYSDPGVRGTGPSTASQTAWVLVGLISAGEGRSSMVMKGIEYLLRSQQADGSWHEDQYTGTGFPRAFYLRYDLYRMYFPLLALARYRACLEEALQ